MVGSALNICHFHIQKSKDHLWSTDIIRACFIRAYFFAVIVCHLELWGSLLLTAKLAKVISTKRINETTGSEQQSMLKSTSNFGNEGTLNLFQRLGDQWALKCLHKAIWQRLHLLIKLLTKIDIQI
jgi:hypothetical protein